MTDKEIVLTPEGFKRLSEEIDYLASVRREEISERIKDAREFGDISENSEYNEAKNEQAKLEMRILKLEQKLRNARVLAAKEITTDTVGIGNLVTLKDVKAGDSYKYTMVSSAEADPSRQRLSSESPVGKAIMGRKAGETVRVTTPRGGIKYKIVSIKKG
ncbi:MAG: transcription elongation factor GreA [Thermoleophilia bacterium]|nr:transcription elongation factor GreA [Thermoleophilia bacterium]